MKPTRAIEFIADVMLDAGVQPDMAARLPSMLSRYGEVRWGNVGAVPDGRQLGRAAAGGGEVGASHGPPAGAQRCRSARR
jgi:hypothetical protein